MKLNERIHAFVELGNFLQQFSTAEATRKKHALNASFYDNFKSLLENISKENLWFTTENVHFSINGIIEFLREDKIHEWINKYSISDKNTNLKVAVVMAGNIPMVGFHDMLCVLTAGHHFIGKLSSKDNQLLNFLADLLIAIHPEFKQLVHFETERLTGKNQFDAIIATGSNNSARYFETYFQKYPNIIRKNRNSIAVLNGTESDTELKALGKDIFLYFGLGCRNVSKIYVPEEYDFTKMLDTWNTYSYVNNHSKYANNYDYQRSLLLMNQVEHLDNGFLLLREQQEIASPIGIVYYEYYSEISALEEKLSLQSEQIQCIVGSTLKNSVPFGKAQEPELWDYADDVDSMLFLTQLNSK